MSDITVKDTIIKTIKVDGNDYICITDIARQKKKDSKGDWAKPIG